MVVKPETKYVSLRSGRRLAYAEFGAAGGTPVIFHHGGPSCRLEAQAFSHGAWLSGVRLIAVDRPGMGRSEWDPEWTFVSFTESVRELADELGLGRFGILGVSGGGPPSLACAYALGDRLTRVAVVAGAPYGGLERHIVQQRLRGIDYLGARVAWWRPTALEPLFRPLAWLSRHGPDWLFGVLLRGLPPTDRDVAREHRLEGLMLRCVRESFVQGSRGPARDCLLDLTPWPFPLEEISLPVTIWQGTADTLVDPGLQLLLSQRVPRADLRMFRGEGHFLAVPRVQELMLLFSDAT